MSIAMRASLAICMVAVAAVRPSTETVVDRLWVWPDDGRLPPNGRLLIEGRGGYAELVAAIAEHEPRLAARDHRVRLRVAELQVVDPSVTQAWLEPVSRLIPGASYLFELDGGPEAAIAFTIEAEPDRGAPIFLSAPVIDGDRIHAEVHDEGPVLLRVETERTRGDPRPTIFYYPTDAQLATEHDPTVLSISAIDAAGKIVEAPGRGELRTTTTAIDPYQQPRSNPPYDLYVKVVDARGRPIEGAVVAGAWRGTPAAKTPSSGEIVFRAVTEDVPRVEITHPVFGRTEFAENVTHKVSHTMLVRMGEGAKLTVRVRVEGVRITLAGVSKGQEGVFRRQDTGANGEVVFGALPDGDFEVLIDGRPAYASTRETIRIYGRHDELLELELARALTASGRILLPPGSTWDGWKVEIEPLGFAPVDALPSTRATVDAANDGSFTFIGLAEGPHRVSAWRDRERTQRTIRVERSMAPIELFIGGDAIVEGTIDYEGGVPPESLEVTLAGGGQTKVRAAADPARGTFVAAVENLGEYRLLVRAPGFRPSVTELQVEGGRALHPRVALMRAIGARGKVIDERGEPLPGVSITPSAPGFPAPLARVITDVEGRFALTEVDPADGVVLRVEARGRAPKIEAVQSETPIIRLPRGAPIVGSVDLSSRTPRAAKMIWRSLATGEVFADLELKGAGGFRVADLPRGVFQVELATANELRIELVRRSELAPQHHFAMKREDVKLVLAVDPELAELGGLTLTVEGAGAAKFVNRAPIPKEAHEIHVAGLPPGVYRATAAWRGEPIVERKINLAGGPVRAQLQP